MNNEKKNNSRTGLEIAVIGMAARFPGAKDICEFWDNLKDGVESLSFISDQELEGDGIDPMLLEDPNYVKASGGMLERKEYFDAAFFDYSPREAELMDPQIRIFHECAWEALEDAGYVASNYGGLIGLYAGSENSLGWESLAVLSGMAFEFGTWATSHLSDKDYLVARVSHRLDLKGPAVTIQTACSTSLAAIHIAGRALLTGDCHIALAGGASVMHTPVRGYLYQEGMIFSPDGHCRAFDAGSQGTVMGEGVGVVVLKPLQTAISDGDHIHAIIKGSAINNDGIGKQGFTAPSVQGQAGVIKAAQRIARVEPESIGYIETHGTGTSLGDPIEIEALSKAFNTKERKFCGLGSVKTNLGHLGATAGVAGFIKTVLALKNRLIPPSLHFETPNPVIDFENSPFYVNTRLRKWENNNGNPLRAGVSSFGIGGTNAHVILEEPPSGTGGGGPLSKYHLILLSAQTPSALDKMTKNLAEYFKENLLNRSNHENPTNPGPTLADAAYTLQVGREAFAYRQVLGCASADEAVEALLSPGPTKVKTFQVDDNEPPVVFMFPGQGTQYVNMGRELYQKEPVFREEMDRCFEILKPLMGYDIKEILYPPEGSDRSDRSDLIDQTGIAQPLLFVFEYSLAKLLLKWGIKPYAMIGHSIGEYVAACLSGVFLLEGALKLVSARGHLMQGLPPGAMLSVPLREEELQPLLELNEELSLAAVNSVSHCVVSGPGQAIDGFEKHLKEKGRSSRRLHTSHAFHSKMMDPILKEFEAGVARVELNEPRVPYISNVTGQWITVSQATSPGYWAGHLRETVRMGSGLGELLKKEGAVFVEVGPGRTLSTFVKQQANNKPGPKVINLVRHPRENTDDTCYLLNKIGHLWVYGKAIQWKEFYRGEKRNRLPLPTYPFAGQRFWIEGHPLKIIAEIYHRSGLHKQDTGGMPGQTLAAPGSTAPPSLEFAAHPRARHQRPQLKNEYTPPRDNIEKTLARTWQNFLRIEKIGINDDLLELGADSLVFATVAAKIYKALQVNIPLAVFFNQPHIKGLAQYTRNAKKDIYYSIEPGEKKEYYVLSSPQQRLYVLSQLDKDSAAYNLPSMLILEGKIDKPGLEDSFKTLVKRHDSLRTSFEMLRGEPIQKIHDDIEFNLDFHDLQALHDPEASQEVIRRFIQPFALPDAPLLRVALVKKENENHLLMVDMHHIISDGTSISLLIEEFAALYNGETLPPLRIQYKDFSGWQNRKTAGELIKEQEEYWLKEFADDIPILNLPTDFKRPVFQSFEGNAIRFELDKEETRALKTYALEEGVTLFMILLAAFNIFLAKITGQEDIVIGTPLAGRDHPDLHKIIGFFLNTLALRNYPTGNKTCKEFLQEIKQKTLASFESQEYPFESLVENLGLERDTSRNPIYSVMLILQISDTNDYWSAAQGLYGLKVLRYEHERNGSPNDISIYVIEREDGLYFSWEYCTRLFKKETSERYIQYFKKVISAVINTPRERISGISIITAEEKQWLLFGINNTRKDIVRDKCYRQLFEEAVEKYPHRLAAWHNREEITYEELNRQANRIAYFLSEQGQQPDSIVGLYMERGIAMLACIIGTFKVGAAYLPIETTYPLPRVEYLLENSEAPVVITNSKNEALIRSLLASLSRQPVVLCPEPANNRENITGIPGKYNSKNPCCPVNPENLSYLMYTSGTTGNPKGVMIQQKGMINHMLAKINYFSMTAEDKLPQSGPASFDISVWQFLAPLLLGGYTFIIDEEDFLNPVKFLSILREEKVTLLEFVPSWLIFFLESIENETDRSLPYLRWMISTGDVLPVSLVRKWYETYPAIKMVNTYGPTEASDDIAHYTVEDLPGPDQETIPVGNPLDNLHIYVLDRYMQLCPPGVRGEICVSGIGVGRGYWKDPAKTAAAFIANPYVDEIGDMDYARLYKMGDIGYIREDGNIECLGRRDHQVKIRGHRLELEEIESQLLAYDKVKEAVVTINQDQKGGKYLCAYVVFPGAECSIEALREYLCKKLPHYMIPSFFVPLDKIPLTPNGKPDRKALPLPGQFDIGEEYVEPRNDIEQAIADVWLGVLQVEKIGIYNDFFGMGGNSLKAITAAAQLSKDLSLTINHIFQYRVIAAIAENVTWKKDYLKTRIKEAGKYIDEIERLNLYEKAHQQIDVYNNEYLERVEKEGLPSLTGEQDYRHILLSGSTGYLGAHLIAELLGTTSAVLYLPIRANSAAQAQESLKSKLGFYFGEMFFQENRERLQVVPMNQKKHKLGMEGPVYDELSETAAAVVHAAANVSYYGKYEDLYKDNVELTEAFMEFANSGRKKDFHYISTLGVCRGDIRNQTAMLYTEYSYDVGQKSDNIYIKTKFEAEKAVLRQKQKGLHAVIYRLGNLVANSQTGKFQENIETNAFFAVMKAFITLGIVPDPEEFMFDMTFIDHTVKAVVMLMKQKNLPDMAYHLMNPHRLTWEDMVPFLNKVGVDVKSVTVLQFSDYMLECIENNRHQEIVDRLLLHSGAGIFDLEIERYTHTHVAQEKTLRILKKIGFEWEAVNESHVRKMIEYCRQVGFIKN